MHHVEPWIDLVYGPITYDVANIEGDPVSETNKLIDTNIILA